MLKQGWNPLKGQSEARLFCYMQKMRAFCISLSGHLGIRKNALRNRGAILVIAALLVPLGVFLSVLTSRSAQAATSSNLNFQGRLLSSTGNLVADGTYNIQFNLYTVSSGGSTQWTESYLNNATQGVTLKNGYFSVNLGSLTAFPGTINWDQEQWLGMTVRGTGSCAFGACTPTDNEMTPRFKLTSVPYATVAGSLQKTSGANELKVTTATPTADVTYTFQDAAAGSYDVCTSANNCTGLGAYIQNGTSNQNTANFNIQSAATGSVTAKFRAIAAQSVDVLQVRDSSDATTVFSVGAAGNTTVAGSLTVTPGVITGANSETLSVGATDATFVLGRNNAGTVTLTAADNNADADLIVAAGGTGTTQIGSATNSSIVLKTGTADTIYFQDTANNNNFTFQGSKIAQDLWGEATGTLYGMVSSSATTQTGAITGVSINTSTNYTVPNSASGNQTGIAITTKDGGASASSTGISLLGTADNAISFGGTFTNLLSATNLTVTSGGNLTLGSSAGTGSLLNNGGTINTTLVVGDDANGGVLGGGLTAAASVDIYTSISVGQTTAGQTISLPTPTASTTYGRILYLSNIGTTSFTFAGVPITQGTTATLVWSNTSGGASWQFAGAGGGGTGANTALSNLASVAINTALLPGADNTIDLGSSAFSFRTGYVDTSLLTPAVDTAAAGALTLGGTTATSLIFGNASTNPSFTFQGTGATSFGGNVSIAATKSLSLAGGNTASRPGSPTEGMIYFDTTTKQLLVYANGKWQADRSTATKIVAANNSSQAIKDAADYVADGTGDQTEINAALTAASGGKVYLAEGTYVANASIQVPNNTTLAGAGMGTVIELADLDVTESLIENLDQVTGTGVTIRDLKIDGRDDLNTAGSQSGIDLHEMGDTSTATGRVGAVVANVYVEDFNYSGINAYAPSGYGGNNTFTGNTAKSNLYGFYFNFSNGDTITGNTAYANGASGFRISGAYNDVITGNSSQFNQYGFQLDSGAQYNTFTGNTSSANTSYGFNLGTASNYNVISSNNIFDNAGSTANNGIFLSASDNNSITGNIITDSACSTTCYAINISNSTSDNNYLANNRFTGPSTAPATINDSGTNTIYGSQLTSAQILQSGSSFVRANVTSVITGSIDPTASASVTGVNTLFLSQLQVGDRITVSTETRTVTAIASNTALTVDTAFSNNANDTSVDRLPASMRVANSSGTSQFIIQDAGNIGIGTVAPDEKFEISGGNILLSNAQFIQFRDAGGTKRSVFGVNASDNTTIGNSTLNDILFTTTAGTALTLTKATGNATFLGDLAVNGGDITSGTNLTVNATGYVRIGDTGTPGVATGDDDLYVEGDLEVDATLDVAGLATFANNITVQGGTINAGAAAQAGTLSISDGSSNTVGITANALAGNYSVAIPTIIASDSFCLATLGNCFGSGSGGTLQAAYNAGNSITTSNARDINFNLANTATDSNFNIDVAGNNGLYVTNGSNVVSISNQIAGGFGLSVSSNGTYAFVVENSGTSTDIIHVDATTLQTTFDAAGIVFGSSVTGIWSSATDTLEIYTNNVDALQVEPNADIDIVAGNLQVNDTTVITSGRALQSITGYTQSTGSFSATLTDNTANILDIQEGTNNYININTTNSSENISFGNATTNPSYNVLGSGRLTVGSSLTNLGAKLAVVGTSDEEQLLIRANATQAVTNPIIKVENSAGSELLRITTNSADSIYAGYLSGNAITTGNYNAAYGANTLKLAQDADSNTALGYNALGENISGDANTAVGDGALLKNTDSGNVAVGYQSLYENTTGDGSVGLGNEALRYNQTGNENSALGVGAGRGTAAYTNSNYNVFLGGGAGYNIASNSSQNVLIGYNAGGNLTSSASNNILIGYNISASSAGVDNELNIGGVLQGDTSTLAAQLNGDLTVVGATALNGNTTVGNATTDRLTVTSQLLGSLTFQGATDNGFTTVLGVTDPTANQTYNLPNSAAGTYELCTSANNCAGLTGYIRNNTALQTAATFNIQAGTTTYDTITINQLVSQTGALIKLLRSDTTTNVLTVSGSTGSIVSRQISDSATALQVQTSGGTGFFTLDSSKQETILRSGNDTTTIGSELHGAPNNFNTQYSHTNWNVGVTTQAAHNTGFTNALVNTAMSAPTIGVVYQVSFRTQPNSSLTCGGSESLTVTFAGQTVSGGAITGDNCDGTFTYLVTASSTSPKITFTPTSGWDGIVSAVSIKAVTGTINSVLTVKNNLNVTNLEVRTSNSSQNTFIGVSSGSYNATGAYNTALGYTAFTNNTTGTNSVALGAQALQSNTTGSYNIAVGFASLGLNTTGANNIGIGSSALYSNTAGTNNLAIGSSALQSNTVGTDNVALGSSALFGITYGSSNIGIGKDALHTEVGGNSNIAIGVGASYTQVQAQQNIAIGSAALYYNADGGKNVIIGDSAFYGSAGGHSQYNNVVIGFGAANAIGANSSDNILIGYQAALSLDSGSRNLIIGHNLDVSSSSVTDELNIGNVLHGNIAVGSGYFKSITNSSSVFSVQDSSALKLLNVDSSNSTVSVQSGNDTVSLGSELYTAGDFTNGSQWTSTNWTTAASTATHNSGNTSVLQNLNVAVATSTKYQVSFTLSGTCGTTSDTVQVTMGGITLGGASINGGNCSGTFAYVVTAINTNKLAFTPSSSWTGTISNVSIMAFTGVRNSTLSVLDNAGVSQIEIRSGSFTNVGNQFVGTNSGSSLTVASANSAFGYGSLQNVVTGGSNTALGYFTLNKVVSGSQNVAVGNQTLLKLTSGSNNVAVGYSQISNTTGSNNTSIGWGSLNSLYTGTYNTGVGTSADLLSGNLTIATAIGYNSRVGSSNSIVVGRALTNGSNGDAVGVNTVYPQAQANTAFQVGTGSYNTGTITSSGTSVTGVGTTWTSSMNGGTILYADGTSGTISAASGTTLTSSLSKTISVAQSYTIIYPGGLTVSTNAAVTSRVLTNATAAFQIQNASGTNLFNVDTTNSQINVTNSNLVIGGAADATSGPTLTNSAAGTFNAQTGRDGAYSMAVYNGKVYAATAEANASGVYRYDGASTWTLVTDSTPGKVITGDTANIDSMVLSVYNGRLYAGTHTGAATNTGAVYAYDGSTWTLVNATRGTFGAETNVDGIDDFAVYNGRLYAVTDEPNAASLYRFDGGTTFTRLNATVGKGLAEATADMDGGRIIQYNGALWWGAITGSTTARIYKFDGNTFTLMTPTPGTVAGVTGNADITSMAVSNGQLFVGVGLANAAFIATYKDGDDRPATPGDDWIKTTDATSGKIITGDTANIDSITSMKSYNGRLYAAVDTGAGTNTAAIYEFTGLAVNGSTNGWSLIGTRGTFNAQTNVDRVSSLVEYNGTLYIGTDDGSTNNVGSVYTYTKTSANSYSLKFSSDTSGNNLGSINFVGTQQSVGNALNTGTFVFSNGISTTTGAYDVAEDYPTRDTSLSAGDIVVLDQNEQGFVHKSTGATYDRFAVGIYSTTPALRLSQQGDTIDGARAVPIALAGRVPVKVTTENGAIQPGDYITTSSRPGYGMKATGYGQVIGKAMEAFDGAGVANATGTVMVFVNVTQYAPSASEMLSSESTITNLTVTGTLTVGKVVVETVQISGTLKVNGDTELNFVRVKKDLELNGKFITKGLLPTIEIMESALNTAPNYDATIEVNGTDVAGYIKLLTREATQSDIRVKLIFNKPYTSAPVLFLTPVGQGSASLGAYVESIEKNYAIIGFTHAPANGQSLQFNYQAIQALGSAPASQPNY